MDCPYCSHDNVSQTPTCAGCGSDLPSPSCRECGVLVSWGDALCWRCESLGSDTERMEVGSGWQVHGIQTPVVGRTREVHVLNELLKTAVEVRAPQTCTVVGPAGMGKSRLAAEFNAQLNKHFDSATVARGACKEGGGPPFLLFGRLLRDRFYIGKAEPEESARTKLLDGVSAIVQSNEATECAHRIGHLIGLPYPASPYTDESPEEIERKARHSLVQLIERDARRAPLVLVLEDLHHASSESLRMLSRLAQELQDAPVLLLCTADESLNADPPGYWTDGGPHTLIELAPLSDEESSRLLAQILKQAGELPNKLVDVAVERSMGNPFTLEEIVRILLETGVVETGPSRWKVHLDRLDATQIPQSQSDVVRARLQTLTDAERIVLEKASIIGNVFWFGALVMLQRLDGEHWQEEDRLWNSPRRRDDLRRILRDLRKKDIIRRSPVCRFTGDIEYAFKHRLERESVYPGESERRATMHSLVAQWLEFCSSEGAARKPIEDIARHYERAGVPTKAAYYHIQAGRMARDRFLNSTAIELYTKGLEALSDADAATKLDVLHDLGSVYDLIGRHDDALCYFREMLRLAWLLANRAKGGVAFIKLGRVYRALGEYEFAMRHLHRSQALFDEVNDRPGVAAALDDIGRVHWLKGELDTALQYEEQSLAIRRELDNPRSVALSLARIGSIHGIRGDFKKAMENLDESLELRRQTGDRRGVAESLNVIGVIWLERENVDKARLMLSEALTAAQEVGAREVEAKVLNNLGESHIITSDLDSAETHLEAALAITKETGARGIQVDVHRNLGRIAMLRGDITTAIERCEHALDIAGSSGLKLLEGLAWATMGEIHSQTLFDASRGDEGGPPGEADRCFRKAVDVLTKVGNAAELGKVLKSYGKVLIEHGRTEDGKAKLEEASEIFRRLEMVGVLERTEQILREVG